MNERKLLIVDDDSVILNLLKDFFVKKGVIVFISKDPVQALEIFMAEKPQIILSDLKLKACMDGLTMCGKMRMEAPKTITIAMTGYLTAYDLNFCLGSGFNDAVSKPFELQDMSDIVETWFRKRKRWDAISELE